jgi:hypothetical protein
MNKVAIGCVGLLAVGVAGGAGASYYAYHKVTSAIAPVARSARSARSTGPEGNMHRRSRSTSATLILALAPGLVAAARPDAAPCPAPTDIETTIGFPVRAHPQVSDHCMYELTGQYQGAFVTLSYQPATRADDLFAEIRHRVKGAKGVNAQPNRVSLGEGGWGYSSRGKKEAATVSHGQLYHVEMDYDLFEDLRFREDTPVRLLELAMRGAPSGKSATSFDACMLATNAEVSQIAEEKPELAKFWSAPEASLGGTNCQYGGGSIQVYRGKDPAAALEATLKAFKADKAPRVPVRGIGDKAFFMIPMPNDQYNRFGMLAVYAGPRVVRVILDAQRGEPIDATRPRLERFARLVLPRLH